MNTFTDQKRFLSSSTLTLSPILSRCIRSSYTKQYQKHEPSSFCYFIKCFDDKVYEPKLVSYTGEDATQKFVDMVEEGITRITNISKKKMIFGKKEKERFDKETRCWICNEKFVDEVENCKVRDHCHFTGRYQGAAHKKCNFLYKKPNFKPVVFHNLSSYNGHLFVKNLGRSEGSINCIPTNEENILALPKKYKLGVIRRK